jgi:hypothetical protein
MVYLFIYLFSDLINRFVREETYLFVLRVMVGLVILYDHVHPVGAFQKSSNMDVIISSKHLFDF